MDYSPPVDAGLSLIHQDEWLLVVDKPSGLLAVPGRGEDKQDCLISRVQARYPEALVVHRLDLATSGLMLLARNKPMQRQLSRMFQERRVNKRYIAVVAGAWSEAEGVVDLPLMADWVKRPRQRVDLERGKPSLTHYRVMAYDRDLDCSRVELLPETGRTHQLRVHMLALGHPILGDGLYAPGLVQRQAPRLLLHAEQLTFEHPHTGQWLECRAPTPF